MEQLGVCGVDRARSRQAVVLKVNKPVTGQLPQNSTHHLYQTLILGLMLYFYGREN